MTLSDFVKTFLLPGSLQFLVLGVSAGVLLLYAGTAGRRWGRRWLAAIAIGYWLMSLPITAELLWRGLTANFPPLRSVDQVRDAEAIVVLTGGIALYRQEGAEIRYLPGATAWRTLEAYRLHKLLPDRWIVVSGGDPARRGRFESEVVREELVRLGVPDARIVTETQSRNTREHALYLPAILKRHGIERFILVTSPTEMRRQKAALEQQGLRPIAAPTLSDIPPAGKWRLLPSASALVQSRLAVLAYLGLVYYWWNGWM